MLSRMSTDLDTEIRTELERRRGEWPSICEAASVSHSWVSQFVRGKIPNPGYATLKRLRTALGDAFAPAEAAPQAHAEGQ